MKNLMRLMTEFAILGMEPAPLEPEVGPAFDPNSVVAGEPAPEEMEYELDADGNPILDANGNPIPKAKPDASATACSCDHNAPAPAALAPAATEVPPAGIVPAIAPQLPPEDEFDFNI